MIELIYENNKGQKINLTKLPYWLNVEPIFNYEWDYTKREKRRGSIVAGFTKNVSSQSLVLHIMGHSKSVRDNAIDEFNSIIESDIYDGKAGKIWCGDWYTYGYIVASENEKWQYDVPVVKKKITLVREQDSWFRQIVKKSYEGEQYIPEVETWAKNYDRLGFEEHTISGDVISIGNSHYNSSAKSLKVALEPIQSGSGTPSPDNVRPISGRTEVVTQRTGKNLLDPSKWEMGENSGLSVSGDALAINSKAYQETLNRFKLIDERDYTFSFRFQTLTLSDSRASFAVYIDGTKAIPTKGATSAGNLLLNSVGTETDVVVPIPSTAKEISFGGWAWSGTVKVTNIQLELGSTATDYEPYQGETYTTDLGQTVYGGTLDVVSGELVVDRAMVTLGGTTDKVEGQYGNGIFYTNRISGIYDDMSASRQREVLIMCDKIEACSWVGLASATEGIAQNTGVRFALRLPNASSVTEANAWLSSNTPTVVYELAEPQTIQLTLQEVQLLLGTNNVWSDGGEVSVTYRFLKKGYDYQYDYMTDFDTSVRLTNPDALPSNFILAIQGYAMQPEIHIGDNVIQFNIEIPEGAALEVNAVTKKTIMHMPDGTDMNVFGARNADYYIFNRIPSGKSAVTWNGAFNWEITLIEERSEPRWRTV